MPLQSSGAIALYDVRTELETSGAISLNDSNVRSLLGVASGAIELNSAYGKVNLGTPVFTKVKGFSTSLATYTYGGYNYAKITGFGGTYVTMTLSGARALEFLLIGPGGSGGFGGGGGGGGGGYKYISNAYWSTSKTFGVSYYASTFHLRAAYDNGYVDDYREMSDSTYASSWTSFAVAGWKPQISATNYGPFLMTTISTSSSTSLGDIAFAPCGGHGGTYFNGGNGSTTSGYFRNGWTALNSAFYVDNNRSATYTSSQANRTSIKIDNWSTYSTSPSAGLGVAGCGGGAFGYNNAYSGGGGTTSGGGGSGGTTQWGGGGGGGLGGNGGTDTSDGGNGGHGGAPLQMASAWVTDSSGTRPYFGGGGGGGGRNDASSGGYSYNEYGVSAYNSYPSAAYPNLSTYGNYFNRGGRQTYDGVTYYGGDEGGTLFGFGGCGGAVGTTLDTSTSTNGRNGGGGGQGCIIVRWI